MGNFSHESKVEKNKKNPAARCDYKKLPAGIGPIPVAIGTIYRNRNSASQVHRMSQAGIAGTESTGCTAVCINGGYIDDFDNGWRIIYTGSSGAEPGKRISSSSTVNLNTDQIWTNGNKALRVSMAKQWPVRVLRGPKGDPEWSEAAGYRYDGLYMPRKCWIERGQTGVKIIRFGLERLHDQGPLIINGRQMSPPDYGRDEEYLGKWPILDKDREVQRPIGAMEPFDSIRPEDIYIKPKRIEMEPRPRLTESELALVKMKEATRRRNRAARRRVLSEDNGWVANTTHCRPRGRDGQQSNVDDMENKYPAGRSRSPPLPSRKLKTLDSFARARQF